MARLVGRRPVETKVSALDSGSIPIYNSDLKSWDTIHLSEVTGSVFPFTGSAIISGSLTVSGSTNIVGTTGNTLLSTNADTLIFTGSLYTSGSIISTGSLKVNGGITGSLLGTASFASNAGNSISSSYAATASSADDFNVRGTLTAQRIVVQTITSSTEYVTGSTQFGSLLSNTHQFTGSVSITGSLEVNGRNYINDSSSFESRITTNSSSFANFSGSYINESSSFASRVTTNSASFATFSGSYINESSSFASRITTNSASFAAFSGSYINESSSFASRITTNSASFATFSGSYINESSSFASRITTNSASFATFSGSYINESSSFASRITTDSASFATFSGSYINESSSFASRITTNSSSISSLSASFREFSGSFMTGSFTGSFTGSLLGTASYALQALTASNANTASYIRNAQTASYVTQAQSASYWSGSIINAESASYATTAENAPLYLPLVGGTLTGNLILDQYDLSAANIRNLGYGFPAAQISTDGNKPISIITNVEAVKFWNTSNVTIQDGGTHVDNGFRLDISGSGRFTDGLTVTGSTKLASPNGIPLILDHYNASPNQNTLLGFYDSGSAVWNIGNSGTTDDFIINNPQTFAIPLRIRQDNSTQLNGNLGVTGSLQVTSGITGSLLGTSSYSIQALSSSYTLQAVSASYTATASSADDFTVRGTLIAQTIVAQTITSSTEFITGSTKNGSLLTNTHQFTGSVGITGSLTVNGSDAILSNQTSSMSVATASYVSSNFQYEVHVSQVDGNDTTGNGDLLNPVASITKALTLTTAQRKVIVLHPGGYTENPTISSGNITIQTTELTGGNTVLSGTLTIPTSGSGARISGFSMDNLAITETAQAYVSNCTVNNNVVKSSSGYVEIINSELQCISGIQISGAGITIINGNKNVGVAVSNASAQVIIKGCNSVVTPSASAGNLAIVDCIVTALGGNGITITGASTTLTLANSQVLVQAGNNVAPISVAGIYSIINTIYDKPGSTITGTSTNSVDYFQYIDADNITTKGLTVTGSINVSGSLQVNGSNVILSNQTSSMSVATASYVENAQTASYVVTAQTASYVQTAQTASNANTASSADNFTVRGTLTAQTIIAQTITSSVEYITGSTQFGSLLSNTHQFTGSVEITGSLSINGRSYTNDSSSFASRITDNSASFALFSGSYANESASFASRITTNSSSFTTFSGSYINESSSFASRITTNSASISNLSASFNTFSSSYNTASFTGSFKGDGAGLYNIPASGITGLNLSQIASGSATASVSPVEGFRVNTNTEITGSLIVTNGITGSLQGTASYAENANLLDGKDSSVFASTGSNSFSGSQTISSGFKLFTDAVENLTGNTLNLFGDVKFNGNVVEVPNDLAVTGSFIANNMTGSLLGTASYAISSSYALTASYANNSTTASYALTALSSSYALTASYAKDIVISGSVNNVNYIDFNTGSAVPAWKSGRVFWDNTDGCLAVYNAEADVTLQVGQENWTRVRNNTGTAITNGTVVRIIGAQGDVPTVTRAQSIAKSGSINVDTQILGVATHNIEDNSFGYVTTQGLVRGLNTSAFTDGASLFVGTGSAGVLQDTAPIAPFEIIPVGVCVKASPGGSGIIYVAVQQPIDFSDLSTAKVGGLYSYGDLWTYVQSGSYGVWTHTNQLSGSYGITGSLSSTNGITGSLFGTASHAVYADYINNLSSASFASTGSNTFIGTQTISGSLIATQGVTASLLGTASYAVQALSASYWSGSIKHVQTSSYAFYAESVGGIISGSIVTTGSNNFVGNQTISGSLSVTGNLSVLGTASFTYVTASQLAISASFISVNVFEPAQRFGGLIVYDSGSSAATASFAWDSLYNHWVYQDVTGSDYSGGVFITGPINTGSLGNERLLTPGRIPKSAGGDHIDDSIINEISGSIGISGSLAVTGSFNLLQSIYKNQNTSSLTSGTKIISTNSTSSYTSAFYNYVLSSGANARAGQFITVWNGSSINYTDVSTTDIGNTLSVVFTASLSGGNVVLSTVLPSNDWTIKTNVNLL
jgi:hypothetical protein